MSDLDLAKLRRPKQFRRDFPNVVTQNSLEWQLRHRHVNGLAAAGAVFELRSRPDQKRPHLFINPDRYSDWLHNQHRYLQRSRVTTPPAA